MSNMSRDIQTISDRFFNEDVSIQPRASGSAYHFVDIGQIFSRLAEKEPELARWLTSLTATGTQREMKAIIVSVKLIAPRFLRNLKQFDNLVKLLEQLWQQYDDTIAVNYDDVIFTVKSVDCIQLQSIIAKIQAEINWQFRHYKGHSGGGLKFQEEKEEEAEKDLLFVAH